MHDEDGYFGDPVASTYDDPFDPMNSPDVVNPTIDVLAALAGDGRASRSPARAARTCRSGRSPAPRR